MHILQFYFKKDQLKQNQISLADTIRGAIYQQNKLLFELLDYENDSLFLEPTLFSYFLSNIDSKNKTSLDQLLYGYILGEKQPSEVLLKADKHGLINLPNLGYIRANPEEELIFSTNDVKEKFKKNQFLESSPIRLCLHITDHLFYQKGVLFDESAEQTLKKYQVQLENAYIFFKNQLPDFWNLIESVTREFVVFSSPNHNSFAGIQHHGTAYFNTENKQKSTIFFIDDIAHQCGHIIFNVLTLETNKFLKVPKDHPLNGFSPNPQENRGVYGAFHGLFTYTTILHSLDKILKTKALFDEVQRHETLGRMGFYVSKFKYDLNLMNNTEILTEEGLEYHRQFAEGFNFIFNEYGSQIALFDYSNQPYTFQYDLFQILNPIKKTVFA